MSVLLEMRKRIAIYGGTFDPIHAGHLEIARQVSQLFAIDEFLFMPARLAPHKFDREVSPSLDRYAMLALATRNDAKLVVSRFELDAPERQYTVDTLSYFRSRLGKTADLFFVLGADSWGEIRTWRNWERLMTLANLIVVTRPGFEVSGAHLGAETARRIMDVRGFTIEQVAPMLLHSDEQRIFVTDVVMCDVSATEVRQVAQKDSGAGLEKMVPPGVAEYIRKYGLYRNRNEA